MGPTHSWILTGIFNKNLMEWHGFNFAKFQWHVDDNMNNNDIFSNWYICGGIYPINPFQIGLIIFYRYTTVVSANGLTLGY